MIVFDVDFSLRLCRVRLCGRCPRGASILALQSSLMRGYRRPSITCMDTMSTTLTQLEQTYSCGAKVGTKEHSLTSYVISDYNIARDRELLEFATTSREGIATETVLVHDVFCKLFMAVLYITARLSSRKLLFPLTQ